jgi:hypothetical protein
MRPPCALTGKMPTSRDRRDRQRSIDAACGNDRVSTQEVQHMDIAASFRGDRFRLVSGVAWTAPKMLRNSATSRVPAGRSDGALPSGRRSLHGHATIGSRRMNRNKWILRRCSEPIVARWFCRNPRNPLVIPAKGAGQEKKSRVGTLPGRKARENTDSRRSKPAKDAPIWGQNGGKWEPRTRDGSK